MAHERVLAAGNPPFVIFLDEFGECAVGFALLHREQFVHFAFGLGEFQFPKDQFFVHFVPVVPRIGVVYLAADVLKLLPIVARCFFEYDFLVVEVLFDGKENLVGIDGLDEVIGYFVSDGLIHDILFLAFRDHDDGNGGVLHFQLTEGVEPTQSGHILVEDNEVEGFVSRFFESVSTVGDCGYFVSFLL